MNSPELIESEEGYTEVFAWGADRYGQLGLGNKHGGRCYCIPRFCTFNVVIKKVACGEEHSAFITSGGQIFTMGSNADGRLGVGDRTMMLSSTPCLVEALCTQNAVEVACGWGHTAAVIDNGDLYTWGVGEYGALGIIDCETQWFPVKVVFSEKSSVKIRNVSCGTRHTTLVDFSGRMFVCGAGDAGQLGTGRREREKLPVQVSSITEPIKQTACGIFHTLVLTESGVVLAMGGNNFGQLGTGTKRSSTKPIKTKNLESEFIVKIAAGHISAALSKKGEVFVWGTGVFGEFVVPTILSGAESIILEDIEVGGCFGSGVDKEGNLYCWGANSSGELGLSDYSPRPVATQVASLQGKPITQIACGGSYSIALGRTIPHKFIPPVKSPFKSPGTKAHISTVPKKDGLREELEASLSISRPSAERRHADTISRRFRMEEPFTSPKTKSVAPWSPMDRAGRINEELLDAYQIEQEKRKELEKNIAEIENYNMKKIVIRVE